jgi:hypothetical protein
MIDRADPNPIVLLADGGWHIVEDSRLSTVGRCGRPLLNRRAHSRLRTVGREAVCRECLRLHGAAAEPDARTPDSEQ